MRIHVRLVPGSKKIGIEDLGQDMFGNQTYKIKITQRPIEGEANRGLIEFLSDHYHIAKSKIKIISGNTSRDKLVDIDL